MTMRVLRVYHAGRDPRHRARERALADVGVEVVLAVPAEWPDAGAERELSGEPFRIVELAVRRPGDVNRHAYADGAAIRRLLAETRPDVLDLHEEPFSLAARQWLRAAPPDLPAVVYTAQNIDKRFPPPFSLYERRTYRRVDAVYPCSRQAAAVARGKGFAGRIEVLPLGYDPRIFTPGEQVADAAEVRLGMVGRLVPEKGPVAAVDALAAVTRERPARLVLVGSGPEEAAMVRRADELGVRELVEVVPWADAEELAAIARALHVLLVPSVATATWAEQFGRVIVEAQASGAVVAGYASGSIPEVAGAAGVVVPEGDANALATAVLTVLADGDEFRRRREQGFAQSAERTWERVAERQAALYETVQRDRAGARRRIRTARAAARAEFGPTASTPAGDRPFAVRLRGR